VRVGIHTGPAVERDGDWFGATVNIAARVSGVAGGGEVLVTDTTREAAAAIAGFDFHERGRQTLRNVGDPVLLYAAVRQGTSSNSSYPVDPVCKMAVDPQRAAATITHEGTEYQFCSLACVQRFATHPERFAPGNTGERPLAAVLARGREGLLALLVLLEGNLAFGQTSVEDRHRIPVPSRAGARQFANQPDDPDDHERPEEEHPDHHHDPPPSIEVHVHVSPVVVGVGEQDHQSIDHVHLTLL
jgi:YHS domain-containing protein